MSFAILRIQKLKSFADVGGSLSHNYRNRETLNADSNRTPLNEHKLDTNEKCMTAIRDRIPEKRRKDAVLCIEHLITASPDWSGWGTSKEADFFEQSKRWLERKYGKNNVVSTTIHRDETTPHLVAYVVPVDEETGRLNAKKYIGGSRHTLSQMQTDFAVEVKELGLDRGIQGSKAKHTSIKEYYEKLNNYENEPGIENGLTYEVPEPEFFESKNAYGEKVAKAMIDQIFDQIAPRFDRAHLLASQTNRLKKDASEARKALSDLQEHVKPYLDALDGLDQTWKEYFDKTLRAAKEQVLEKRKQLEVEKGNEELSLKLKKEERIFQMEWNNTFASFNKEQIKNYEYQFECLEKEYPVEFYRQIQIKSLQENLILNSNYKRYIKNEFHQEPVPKVQPAPKKDQEKRSDNDYDSPSAF